MKLKIGVIFGGNSLEHEISILTAIQAMDNLDEEKYEIIPIYIAKDYTWYAGGLLRHIDSFNNFNLIEKYAKKVNLINKKGRFVLQTTGLIKKEYNEIHLVIPMVHGAGMEDGTIQGYLQTLGIPYVSNNIYSSVICQDKVFTKEILDYNEIPVIKYVWCFDNDYYKDKKENLSDRCKGRIEKIKDYAEDSLPVLNKDRKIIGIITAQDVVEAVDDELGEDYAKLAGLSAEEDLNETIAESIKKRLPWLIILLFLGMGVSTVVGAFEGVVAVLPVVICFQSLILDMAGNVGTQSLAVTIRVLMDENLSAKDKLHLAAKEMKVGSCNGALLGVMALVFLGVYIVLFKGYSAANAFLISGCVGLSLLAAIVISSLVGTLVPMLFHKVKIDPAVASGPLITTINDLVAVVAYYGLCGILLIGVLHLAG